MNVKDLDSWYLAKEYDPENKEVNRIRKLGKIKNRKVLVIGTYGVLSIASKIVKYATTVTAVHKNKKLINYCKKNKSKKVEFKYGNIAELHFPAASFDVILCPWEGLYYKKKNASLLRKLNEILKDKGILLIEEANEKSEYVKILNVIIPLKKSKIKKYRDNLKIIFQKYFVIKENKLNTYYEFKNKKQLKEYFQKEIIFNEKKKFTKEGVK